MATQIDPLNLLGTPPELGIHIFPILRIGLIVFLFFYLIVALMVIKQIMMMTKTVKSRGDNFLFILAYLHLFVVLITLLFSLFVL